ncbi:large subunit ribosomal protein L12e [Enteropsectra breve]|nr:large subunit ribosomal protein L12e [Enteropsectra breve]
MVQAQIQDPDTAYLVVRTVGGELPGPTFSQKVGPLKIPGKVVGEDVKKLTTRDFAGQKIHVQLAVKDRKATCTLVPTTAQRIIRELKEVREAKKKGAEKQPALHNGSITLASLFKIANEIKEFSRAKSLKGTVKEVLGTALAVGCTIEGKSPKEVTAAISMGRSAVVDLFELPNGDDNGLPAFLDE